MLRAPLFRVSLAFVAFALIAGSADAALPKPWQWTTTKAATRLTAIGPTTFQAGEIGNTVYGSVCRGLGPGVLTPTGRRYTRFACIFKVGSTNGAYKRAAIVRILPTGTGKLCLDVTASATYIFDAQSQAMNNLAPVTENFISDPGRICP